MLRGEQVVLRPIRERDLAGFCEAHAEIANRGAYFPLGVQPEPALHRRFAETGFWERDEGTLLVWSRDDVMLGHVEFFRAVSYWDAYEISYQLYDSAYAGNGYTTEAVRLLVDYLFASKKIHRLHLVIVPENARAAGSPRSWGSSWRARSGARSSTTVGTTTCCSTPCCAPTLVRGTRGVPRQARRRPRSSLRG